MKVSFVSYHGLLSLEQIGACLRFLNVSSVFLIRLQLGKRYIGGGRDDGDDARKGVDKIWSISIHSKIES